MPLLEYKRVVLIRNFKWANSSGGKVSALPLAQTNISGLGLGE